MDLPRRRRHRAIIGAGIAGAVGLIALGAGFAIASDPESQGDHSVTDETRAVGDFIIAEAHTVDYMLAQIADEPLPCAEHCQTNEPPEAWEIVEVRCAKSQEIAFKAGSTVPRQFAELAGGLRSSCATALRVKPAPDTAAVTDEGRAAAATARRGLRALIERAMDFQETPGGNR